MGCLKKQNPSGRGCFSFKGFGDHNWHLRSNLKDGDNLSEYKKKAGELCLCETTALLVSVLKFYLEHQESFSASSWYF